MATFGKGWDVPPEADSIGDFRWWKLGGNRVLLLVVVSHEPVFYRGHYHGKRMVPCAGEGCKLCAQGIGAQLRFVFAAAEAGTRQVGLMEVGRSVGLELRDLAARHGQFRGMPVEFMRVGNSRQSRMEVRYIESEGGTWWAMLPVPEVKKALELTWKRGNVAPDEPSTATKSPSPGKRWSPPKSEEEDA